ncbi:MAG TPA: hypothetical protein VF342_02700 [Alphaproteobacteria bacterium]
MTNFIVYDGKASVVVIGMRLAPKQGQRRRELAEMRGCSAAWPVQRTVPL